MLLLFSCTTLFAQRGGSLKSVIDSLNSIAYDKPVEVLRACDSLITITKKEKKIRDLGLLLQIKGVAETSLGNNKAALENHMASFRLFDSLGSKPGIIYSLCNISAVYINTGDFEKAESYLLRALPLTPKDDNNSLSTIYGNLGAIYDNGGKPEKAIASYKKAINYLTRLRDYNGLAVTYHNIAQACIVLADLRQAEIYGLKAYGFQQQSGSTNTFAMVSLALGNIYTQMGNFEKAHHFLEQGGEAALELDSPYHKETYYEYKAQWHRERGEHKAEAGFLYRLLTLRDSINAEENEQISSALEQRFQNDLQTKQIALLEAGKSLAEANTARNKIMWIVFCVTSVLTLIIAVVLYRNYKLKQKANIALGKEKSQLEEQKLRLENENILVQFETLKNQISPHFLFNSLNALAVMIKQDPEKAQEFTSIFSKIFRNILELKSETLITLSEELQHVESYIYLQKMRFGENIIINIDISGHNLKQYLPPFALQMVIENAIKHNIISKGNPLTVTIAVEGNYLKIVNNLQKRTHVADSTSIGINNIKSRYKYFDSPDAEFTATNTHYLVKLPLINTP